MADLQAYVAEQKKGKSSFLGKSAASESDSDSASLLSSWVPSSVNISVPSVFGSDQNEKPTDSSWFSEAKKDPMCPALSRKQRLIGFACCICGGIFCFSLASLYVPLLLLKARKFALLYSLGSLFMINSFSFLWGPWNHAKHLMTRERLPFTTAYFGSLFATLYFAMWLRSTLFTSIAAVIQIVALLWYLVSYIPGGQTGLSFISKLFTSAVSRTVSKSMPV
uniref:Vesicle transport protein n=1 Tax=Phallusia mammillata TaxID=59560 RepID=A0A6F9DSR4_9ASCI|nr:protein transport protein SFT2-like [Phallusia mammillata]